MTEKELIGGVAVLLGIISYAIYIWGIYRHTVRPHLFTWLIWGLLMVIGCAAQYAEGGGPGAWNLGVSAFITLMIAGAAYFYGEKQITRSDWAAFIIALSAVPAWLMTNNPLWAVVIVSAIDALAFYPTFRKAWFAPAEESALSFFLGAGQFFLSILALQNLTLTTVLYPAVVVVMNLALVGMLVIRRKKVVFL